MQPNLIGVIIPCHNHKKYIDKSLGSVLSQDYDNKVIVIIDDGSTDNVYEYIENKISDKSKISGGIIGKIQKVPIILLRNDKPTGPSAARNVGIQTLMQNFPACVAVCMLDADDKYLPNKISRCVQKWMENPNQIGIVYHDILINNIKNGTFLYEYREPYDRQRLEQEDIICNCPLVSIAALIACGGYDQQMRTCEDWDLWLRTTARFIAIHIPEALAVYSVTGQNSSDTVDKSIWQQNWNIIRQRIQAQHGQR